MAGAGSVGSYIAENLVRSGVGILTIIDPDQVDPIPTWPVRPIRRPTLVCPSRRLLPGTCGYYDPAVMADGRASTLGATISMTPSMACHW